MCAFERSEKGMEFKMKKWKIINIITIIIFILFFIMVFVDMIICIRMKYPHPMLGLDANNWFDQFKTDLVFMTIIWAIPILINLSIFIVSKKKMKK